VSKFNRFGLPVLLGIALGGFFGHLVAQELMQAPGRWMNMVSEAEYGHLAFLQDQHVTAPQGRQALLDFIDYSRSIEDLHVGPKDWAGLWDRGTAYLRLACWEKKSGNADLFRQYVLLSYQSYKAAGRNTSEQDLIKQLETWKRCARP
jgi:hypothetical protein